jgi:hypothetical protein
MLFLIIIIIINIIIQPQFSKQQTNVKLSSESNATPSSNMAVKVTVTSKYGFTKSIYIKM